MAAGSRSGARPAISTPKTASPPIRSTCPLARRRDWSPVPTSSAWNLSDELPQLTASTIMVSPRDRQPRDAGRGGARGRSDLPETRAGGHGRGEADKKRVRALRGRSHLGHEERRDEERMPRQLDDTELTVLAEAAQAEAGLVERGEILGVDAVVAPEVLDGPGGSVELSGSRARDDDDALLRADQRAGQRRDDESLGVRRALGMIGVLEPEDVARELDDRVLEATSRAHERDATLPGEANGGERAIHAAIRARGRDEQARIARQPGLRLLRHHVDGRYPLGVNADVGERLIGRHVGRPLGAEISDDPHQRPRILASPHRSHRRVSPTRDRRSASRRPPGPRSWWPRRAPCAARSSPALRGRTRRRADSRWPTGSCWDRCNPRARRGRPRPARTRSSSSAGTARWASS